MKISTGIDLLKQTVSAWLDNNAARLGAALAFYSILSLSPLLVLILAAATAIWGADAAQGHVANELTGVIGAQGAQAIQGMLAAAASNKYSGVIAALIGIFSLLFSASAVFGELQEALNLIWRVPAKQGQPIMILVRERLFSSAMVIVSGFLLLLSVFISTGLAATAHYINGVIPAAVTAMRFVNLFVSLAVVALLFALIFKTVPDRVIPWKSVWPGAILTAVLFIVGKGLIGFYLGYAGVGSSYGAAGSLIILLVWVYYSAQILFFGAEFTYVFSCHYKLHEENALEVAARDKKETSPA